MKTFRRLAVLLLLLSLPLPGYCFDMEGSLRYMARVLLQAAAGALGVIALLAAITLLIKNLCKPEAANPAERRAAGLRIGLLTLPATVVVYGVVASLSHDPYSNQLHPAILRVGILGIATCLLLWWRQRPTAAIAVLSGLLVAGTIVGAAGWVVFRQPPMPLGLLGNPVFSDVSPPTAATKAADTRA